jgi:V8-like Glu-specific endopeptidase
MKHYHPGFPYGHAWLLILPLLFPASLGGCDKKSSQEQDTDAEGDAEAEFPDGVDSNADTDDPSELPPDVQEDEGELPPLQDECGFIKPGAFPIINGTSEPDSRLVDLSASRQDSIGAILVNDGWAFCSATLIAPNAILSAAHCFGRGRIRSVEFLVGPDSDHPEHVFNGVEWHNHPDYGTGSDSPPQYDMAVVIIDGDTAAAGLTPIPVSCASTSLLGREVVVAGYGQTDPEDPSNVLRWWTTLSVEDESSYDRMTYGFGSTGTCWGDSGGPMLHTGTDGQVRVMGVLSVGTGTDCLGYDWWPRTDYHCDFIEAYAGSDPCEGETLAGRCEGSAAVWCESGAVVRQDCEASGQVCGLDGAGHYRCLTPGDPCEGETFEGRCDGNTAVWCEDGALQRVDCAEGTLCADAGDGTFRCVDECSLIGMIGRCDVDNTARWCEDGEIRTRDCALCDQICGWMNDALGYYCL